MTADRPGRRDPGPRPRRVHLHGRGARPPAAGRGPSSSLRRAAGTMPRCRASPAAHT